MRWKSKKSGIKKTNTEIKRERALKKRVWHNWFAWYKIKIDNYCYWLEVVERRWIPLSYGRRQEGQKNPYWIYRAKTL